MSAGPGKLAQQTAEKTDGQSDLRTGIVTAVTARGITVAVAGGAVTASHGASYAPAVGDTVALMKTLDSWIALDRIVGPGTPSDYTAPGSGMGPTVLAAMHTTGSTTLASSTGLTVPVPKYTLTYYHPPGHSVLFLVFFTWISTVSADWIIADLTETTTASAVGEFLQPQVNASFGRADLWSGLASEALGGAKRTVSMTMARLTGTGTTSVNQTNARPGYMIALDLGDKSVIIPT